MSHQCKRRLSGISLQFVAEQCAVEEKSQSAQGQNDGEHYEEERKERKRMEMTVQVI